MNFHELMAKAAENQESKKTQTQVVKRYNTVIPPPKKEVKQKGMSPNVMAFLARKEEEARKKAEEQKKCREKYLERSKKCYRKEQNIREMLKEGNEKDKTDEELAHVKPTLDKTAETVNTKFSEAHKNASSSSKPGMGTEKQDTSKKKRQGNAPTYSELLKIAAESKKNDSKEKVTKSRPMTAKEKEELERQAAYKKTKEYRIWKEYGPAALEKYIAQQRLKENEGKPISENSDQKQLSANKTATKRTSDGKPVAQKSGAKSADNRSQTLKNGKKNETRPEPAEKIIKYDSTNENLLVCRPARTEMSPWDRLRAQNANMRDRFNVVADSASEDSDYDEEDDFIDDGPLENDPYGNDVSSHIRSIFGYDKRKFRDFDDDDRAMESSYREQMKEEAESARQGMKEDLEDIRREEDELKRKQALKKKMRR